MVIKLDMHLQLPLNGTISLLLQHYLICESSLLYTDT
jgi:hypothetical protein